MELDLQGKLVNIFGPGDSGKSNFIRYVLSKPKYHRHVIFTPTREYDPENYNVYFADGLEYDKINPELNNFLKEMTEAPREKRPRYVVIEEAANSLPGGNKSIGAYAQQLAWHNTHFYPGMTMITSNRHPTDLDSTIREMYDHMFIFGLRGENAKRCARGMCSGVVEVVESLNQYEFVHVDPQGEINVFEPVEDMGEYDML